ncbi:MAG: hypothetical protein JO247_06705 [Chloroflexi bacterium]|nr:hypothetical protein [Chloroflexota bacterium]
MVSRREFLGLVAGGASLAVLSACGGSGAGPSAASGGVPPASGTAATAGKNDAALPLYIPTTNGPKPDYHNGDPRIDDGFDVYPANAKKALPADPPGTGSTVNILMRLYTTPYTPFDQNATWHEVNKQLNANVQFSSFLAADYITKFATTMAGNDLPDVMHLFGGLNQAADLPAFFKAKCADLTPFLSGSAAKDYPNLAAIPTYAWKNTSSAIDGHLYMIPIHRYLPGSTFLYKQKETWDKVIGPGVNPKTLDDLTKMLKQLNNPAGGVYAFGDFWSFNRYGINGFAQIMGAPNGWRLESSGKLTKDWETEEFKAAVSYVRDLWAQNLMHPDSNTSTGNSRDAFVAGKYLTCMELYGNGWNDFWRRGLLNNPPYHFEFIPPFAKDGGKYITYVTGGFIATNVLKAGSPERIKEVLRILNWLAAPFGSAEDLLLTYGIKDQDYTVDSKGNPVLTANGKQNAGYVPWQYVAVHPYVNYQADLPGWPKQCFDAENAIIPNSISDPTNGYVSATNGSKGPVINQPFYDGINAIMLGRQPLSDYDQVVMDWAAKGGDTIRHEFEQAIAAAK